MTTQWGRSLRYTATLHSRLIFQVTASVAEFIIGNPLRKWARKYPLLQQTLWALDYALLWLLQSLLRCRSRR